MKLTNPTRETIPAIPVKGPVTNGQPATESLAPGETRDIPVDPENPTVRGLLFAGALTAEAEQPKKASKE